MVRHGVEQESHQPSRESVTPSLHLAGGKERDRHKLRLLALVGA